MADQTIKTIIQHRHDTEANWHSATCTKVPLKGEIIVYDIDATHTYERFKIGDGTHLPKDLPFAAAAPDARLYYVDSNEVTVTAGSDTSNAYLAARWATVNVDGITQPSDGMSISLRTPNVGYKGGILLSIDNGNTYYPIVRNVNTLVTTNYPAGSTLILTFNDTQKASPYLTAGTATEVTGCWQIADYDSNTTYTNVKLGHGYTTCSTAASTVAKTASLSSYTLTTGGIVAVKFASGNTASKPTLNINSKGAKSIYYRGAALTDTSLIKAGDTVTFIYSTNYHIISIDRLPADPDLSGYATKNELNELKDAGIIIVQSGDTLTIGGAS